MVYFVSFHSDEYGVALLNTIRLNSGNRSHPHDFSRGWIPETNFFKSIGKVGPYEVTLCVVYPRTDETFMSALERQRILVPEVVLVKTMIRELPLNRPIPRRRRPFEVMNGNANDPEAPGITKAVFINRYQGQGIKIPSPDFMVIMYRALTDFVVKAGRLQQDDRAPRNLATTQEVENLVWKEKLAEVRRKFVPSTNAIQR
jgi:hypothetical protein